MGRFAQADTIVPGGVQGLDRYAYVLNSPVTMIDPSGHYACLEGETIGKCERDPDWHPGETYGKEQSNIPFPQYNYQCSGQGYFACITRDDDFNTQITHTVFGEGGSLSNQAAADILQTILNRAYIYWTEHHAGINPDNIPWEQISTNLLTKLILFILSEPYTGSDGVQYPAYNAWGVAYPHEGEYWNAIKIAVENILNHPGVTPSQVPLSVNNVSPQAAIQSNVNVIYYASDKPGWEPSVPWVAVDYLPPNNPQLWQYYGIYPINP